MRSRSPWVSSTFTALACATVLALGATTAPPPSAASSLLDARSFVEAAQAGKLDPESYDFEVAGFFKLSPPERTRWQIGIYSAQSLDKPDAAPACSEVGQRNGYIMAWTQIASQSTDLDDWKATSHAIHTRLADVDQLVRRSAPEKPSSDPLVQELLSRFARDQAVRSVFSQSKWTEGLSPVAANNWMLAAFTRMNAIDCDNTAWLKSRLAKIGWFTIPKFGEDADTAAWHLVQHADRNPAFQREMLDKLQALPPGETSRRRLGTLFDRVARAEGRPQRYGTQGTCKDGQWTPFETEDPENLDKRRAAIGMEPIADHMKTVSANTCPH